MLIVEINRTPNTKIKYRCVHDKNVYGNTENYKIMKNDLITSASDKYLPGFTSATDANRYITDKLAGTKITTQPDYVVTNQDTNSQYYKDLKKYAMFTGAYSFNNLTKLVDTTSTSDNILRVYNDKTYTTANKDALWKDTYDSSSPLICNVVYPQVLGLLDSDTKDKNEVSCDYAKQCGISWSSLKCK